MTRQHKGCRVWFVCFHCDRRVSKLYRVGAHWLFRRWGCRVCLGLSYPSQTGHKTQARDRAITQGLVRAGWREEEEAYERQYRRMTQLFGEMDRLLESLSRR